MFRTKRNKIRNNSGSTTIDTIYQQTADASCKITETIGAIEKFPFSGPAKAASGSAAGKAEVNSKVTACPVGSLPSTAKVKVDWSIATTKLKGEAKWTGLAGKIPITMPGKVGAYTVSFTHTIDGIAPLT